MPRSRVLLVVRAVMWCGVVAYDATPRKATCLPCTSVPLPHYDALHSDRTKHRSLRAISHPPSVTSNRKTTFSITDGEAMTPLDPDTGLKCDSCCASSEHLFLCVEVITQVEDHRNSQRYTIS